MGLVQGRAGRPTRGCWLVGCVARLSIRAERLAARHRLTTPIPRVAGRGDARARARLFAPALPYLGWQTAVRACRSPRVLTSRRAAPPFGRALRPLHLWCGVVSVLLVPYFNRVELDTLISVVVVWFTVTTMVYHGFLASYIPLVQNTMLC